eukprot:sb/3470430/
MFRLVLLSVLVVAGIQVLDAKPPHHKGEKGPKEHPLFMPKPDKECMKECGCLEEDKECKLFCHFNCLTDAEYSEICRNFQLDQQKSATTTKLLQVNAKFMEKFGLDIGEIGIVEAVKIWRSSKDQGETEGEPEVFLSLMDNHGPKGDKGPKEHPLFMPKVDKECMKECGCQEEEKDCKLLCHFNCLTDGEYTYLPGFKDLSKLQP